MLKKEETMIGGRLNFLLFRVFMKGERLTTAVDFVCELSRETTGRKRIFIFMAIE